MGATLMFSKSSLESQQAHSNIDAFYGPYTTIEQANHRITEDKREIGLTVGIYLFKVDSNGEYYKRGPWNGESRGINRYETTQGTNSIDSNRYSISGIIEYWYLGGIKLDNLVKKNIDNDLILLKTLQALTPDEKEIVTKNIFDKAYDTTIFNGTGKVYLRKNIQIVSLPFDGFSDSEVLLNDTLEAIPTLILWSNYYHKFIALDSNEQFYEKWPNRTGYTANLTITSTFNITELDHIVYYKYSELNGGSLVSTNEPTKVNVLTQDMLYRGDESSRVPNTNITFVIQHDFDLNSLSITIPTNSILEFDGGSFKNGTLASDDYFEIKSDRKCLDNISFSGECIKSIIPKLEWWVAAYPKNGADTTVDNTDEIRQCINCGCLSVQFPWDKFLHLSQTIVMEYPVSIMVESHNRNNARTYAGSSYYSKATPCLFSYEVVTLFEVNLTRRTNYSKYPFTIGQLNIYVDVPYNELTTESINTPVIDIKSGPSSSSSRGQTTSGIILDCNIKAQRYYIPIPVDERLGEDETTRIPNYTAVRVDSETGPISHIRLNGDINYFFCGARIIQGHGGYTDSERANWLTDIIVNGSTTCCYGVRTNTGQLIVHESHEPCHVPTQFRDYEGYFVGTTILFYGFVWDLTMKSDVAEWHRANSSFSSTKNAINNTFFGYKESYEGKIRYLYNNPITYIGHCCGNVDLQGYPNLLYNALSGVSDPIRNLSYKIKFNSDDEFIESLNTDRIINKHLLFNDHSRATIYNALGGYSPSTLVGQAYTKEPWKAIEVSFVLRSTNLNFNASWAPLHLLVGVTERRASENPTVHIKVCTGSTVSGIDMEHPIYDSDIAEPGLRVFTEHIKLDLDRLGISSYSQITVTITRKGTNMLALPFISIPNYFGDTKTPLAYDSDKRPYLDSISKGLQLYDNNLKKEIVWDGTQYISVAGEPLGYALKYTPEVIKGYNINTYGDVGQTASLTFNYNSNFGWPGLYDSVYVRVSKGSLVKIRGVAHMSYKLWALIRESDSEILASTKNTTSGQAVTNPFEEEISVTQDCVLVCNFCNEHFRYTDENNTVVEKPYGNTYAVPYSLEIYTNTHITPNKGRGSNSPSDLTQFDVGSSYLYDSQRLLIWSGARWITASGYTYANVCGNTSNRPKSLRAPYETYTRDKGYRYFDTSLGKPIYAKDITVNNDVTTVTWVESDGAIAGVKRSGTTDNRPIGSSIYKGFVYTDTDLGKPVWALSISGDTVTWVDATGTTV